MPVVETRYIASLQPRVRKGIYSSNVNFTYQEPGNKLAKGLSKKPGFSARAIALLSQKPGFSDSFLKLSVECE